MALIKCAECGQQVSDEAKACPSCGAKPKKRASSLSIVAAVLVVSVIAAGVMSKEDRPTPPARAPTPAEQAAADKKEAEFQFAVTATKALRSTLRNPASFELVKAGLRDDGPLCLVYRGTNGFNAITTEQIAIRRDLKKGNWNKECAGKSQYDVSHLVHAL